MEEKKILKKEKGKIKIKQEKTNREISLKEEKLVKKENI